MAEVERALLKRCDWRKATNGRTATVIVGFSGGADSTALLLALAVLSRRKASCANLGNLRPVAVQVNHQLRKEAAADAAWAAEACRRLGIDCRVVSIDPRKLPGNLYDNARRLRYEALAAEARPNDAATVAVAHHADDQFETMLMALCRGAGVDGLAGMAPVRELEPGVRLIRPLLEVTKRECESMCRAAGIQWREDATNLDVGKARGRLRRKVMAELEAMWPGVALRSAGTARAMEAARQAINEQVTRHFGRPETRRWERRALAAVHPWIVGAGLRRAALHIAGSGADRLTERVVMPAAEAVCDSDRRPRTYQWPGGIMVKVTSKTVEIEGKGSTIQRRGSRGPRD